MKTLVSAINESFISLSDSQKNDIEQKIIAYFEKLADTKVISHETTWYHNGHGQSVIYFVPGNKKRYSLIDFRYNDGKIVAGSMSLID